MTYAQGSPFQTKTNTEMPAALSKSERANKIENKDTPTGSISGTVMDQAGAVVPGATISIKSENTNRNIRSDDNGFYKFENLPFEKFEITVNSNGFTEFKRSEFFLTNANSPRKFDVSMEVEGLMIMGGMGISITFENPLVEAAFEEEPRKVQSLISRGADVNAKDREFYSRTALHIAVSDNNLKIVQILLNAGADVNTLDGEGNTTLMMLDEETSEEIVNLLVKYGAKLDIQAKESKKTALIHAAMQDNYKAMRILIKAGANVNLRDSDGDSALDLADDEETEQLLIAYGAVESSEEN
jgi:ankyrin repeat protein